MIYPEKNLLLYDDLLRAFQRGDLKEKSVKELVARFMFDRNEQYARGAIRYCVHHLVKNGCQLPKELIEDAA